MEKRDGTKVVALVALVVAVVALSVGFATFTATLNITNAKAVIEKNDVFSANVQYTGTPTCYYTGGDSSTDITSGSEVYSHGEASGHSWANVKVPLTMDHKSVTCTATVTNSSIYAATLTEITSNGTYLTYTNGTGSDAATNAETVLQNTTVTVTIGGSGNSDTITYNKAAAKTTNLSNVIQPNGTATVTLLIEYGSSGPAADGDVTINIPLVDFTYESTAPSE